MDFLDKATLTEHDKFLLMCIQRIEQLESDFDRMQSRVRDTIIRDIACIHSKPGLAVDMLAYFLKVPTHIRNGCNTKTMIIEVLPMYRHNWTQRLTDLSKIVPYINDVWGMTAKDFNNWGSITDDSFGDNIYAFLEALTYEELEGYWNTFRLVWTKWKTEV